MLIKASPRGVRGRRTKTRPAVRPLTLVSASFMPEAGPTQAYVRLTFDRAVNVNAADAAAFSLIAGEPVETRYAGDGAVTLVTPETIQVDLSPEGSAPGEETILTMLTGNGIRAVDDGGMWARVGTIGLPYAASALVLVTAEFEVVSPTTAWLRLGFDLPVDVSEVVDMTVIQVYSDKEWRGQLPVTLLNPFTLQIPMIALGPFPGAGVKMYAGGDTYLRPVGDPGAYWNGVGDLELPYGA